MTNLYKVHYIDNSDKTRKVRIMEIAGDTIAEVRAFCKHQDSFVVKKIDAKKRKVTHNTRIIKKGRTNICG